MAAIKRLEQLGYVESRKAMAYQLENSSPLLSWKPGRSTQPDFTAIASANRRRWNGEVRETTVITATRQAIARFGGSFRKVRPQEVEHDLRVANFYLDLSPQDQSSWRIEDAIPNDQFGDKRPDAVVIRNGTPVVIEAVGRAYGSSKLQSIFQHFQNYHLELI